jgi:hypothetical protein
VDAAYEFIFATIAMQRNRASSKVGTDDDIYAGRKLNKKIKIFEPKIIIFLYAY